ncbi:hypothetical protein JIM95_005760 [Corynebacterium sp. CCM 8835]|uniref:Uncharacterized protein n=1 Tax=Corynebacterium antarcticum TaxID=2800405 RepID=A0A9Q4CC54_9CORY|nr:MULTISPECIES: hypothetical protein [Corynebacterium]MBV7292770.1 hypothetical protein [Corynebacterium sp. TAE3-ERU16]MCK7642415.1 hypothetical protein [Corynebacterium antarcticum]MCK7660900.1 hypothetical protein [Corynebacterium antarcticum]MCL0245647.1 hypothetical protein [Corynebacterium antarcticum]MCX7491896.1 hypothetical protein [Corynebacterium antarcticum]
MSAATLISDLLQVLLAGLVLGAGLPALFAVGIRLATPAATSTAQSVPVWRKGLAGLCFAVIIGAIILGIMWITKGVFHDAFGLDPFGTEAH